VSAEERRARKLVRARSGGVCEGCGQAPATNYSHRIGRGVGGRWCPSNALDLCGSGITGCHGYVGARPKAARDERGWRLRSTDDPLTFPVLHAVHGLVLLDADGGFRPVEPIEDVAA
jgi:hypothetical protein